MDIGSLTGQIAIEDQVSGVLDRVINEVKAFATEFDGALGAAAIGAATVVAGVAAITAAVVALGDRGSDVNDVRDSLDRFAGSSENAEKDLSALRDGVRGTIDDFILMRTESKLLSAGVKLNSDDFKTLGDAAFTLQNRGFGDTERILQTLNQSMLTGRTRSLQMMGVVVDLRKAEEEYASSLGVQKNQLSAAGKAAADRQGIIAALNNLVKDAGVQERDFGEQLQFAEATLKNWFDELASGVAESPNVLRALDAIGAGFQEVFGDGAGAIQTFTGWINRFADAVTASVPYIVSFANSVKSTVGFLLDHKVELEKLVAVYVTWKAVGVGLVWMEQAKLAFAAWTLAVEGTTTATLLFEAAWTALEWATGTIAIVAVGLALYELVTHWTEVKNTVGSVWDYVVEKTQWMFDIVKGVFSYITDSSIGRFIIAVTELGLKIAGWAVILTGIAAWELLTGAINIAIDVVQAFWSEFAKPVLGAAWEILKGIAITIGGPFVDSLVSAAQFYHALFDPLIKAVEWLNAHLPGAGAMMEGASPTTFAPAAPTSQPFGPIEDKGQTAYNLLAEGNAADVATAALKKHNDEMIRSGSVSKEAKAAQEALRKALEQQAGALIPLSNAQKDAAESNQKLGLSSAQTAAILRGPSVSAIDLYLTGLKSTKELLEHMSDVTKTVAAKASAAFKTEQLALVAESTKTYTTLLRATQDYTVKNSDLMLKGQDLELAQISRARDAAITALGQRTDATAVLYDRAKAQVDIFYDHEVKKATDTADTLEERMREQGVFTHAELQKQADKSRLTYEQMAADPDKWEKSTIQHFKQVAKAAQDAADDISHPFKDAFKNISAAIPGIIQSAFTGGGGIIGAVKAGGSLVGSELAKSGVKSLTKAFPDFMGSALGQMVGSAIPIIGAAIGPAIEGLIMLFGDHVGKDLKKRGKEIGVEFSDGFLQQLRDDSKKYGGEVQAMIVDLSGVIKEAGGLNDLNLDKFEGQLRDTFVMIETHQLTVAQGSKVVEENWNSFVKAGTSGAGVLDESLKEIINLSEEFGIKSAAMTQYMQNQMKVAGTGITSGITIASNALAAYDELNKKQMDLRAQMAKLSPGDAALAGLQTQLDETMKKLNEQGPLWDIVKIKSQESAAAISSTVVGMIAANQAAGMSFIDAVKAAQPAIDGLEKQFEATGFSGGEAFDFIKRELALATDEIAGPALTAMSAYTQGLVGLNNAGRLNQETFIGITSQISGTEAALEAAGKSHADIMAAMQGDLQKVWELQQNNNYAVDEATQKLLDEAVASGSVGESHKTMGEQTVDALNRITTAIEAVARGMGFLPPAAEAAAQGIDKSFGDVIGPDGKVDGYMKGSADGWNKYGDDIAAKMGNTTGVVDTQYSGCFGRIGGYLDESTGEWIDYSNEVKLQAKDAMTQLDAKNRGVVGPGGTVSDYLGRNTREWQTWQQNVVINAQNAASGVNSRLGQINDKTVNVRYNVETFSEPGDFSRDSVFPQAAGGDYLVTKPTLFLAGEAGPERAVFSGAGKTSLPGDGQQGVTLVVKNDFSNSYFTSQEQMETVVARGVMTGMGRTEFAEFLKLWKRAQEATQS